MNTVVGNVSAALADLKAELQEAVATGDSHRARQLEDKISLLELQAGGWRTEMPRRRNKGEA